MGVWEIWRRIMPAAWKRCSATESAEGTQALDGQVIFRGDDAAAVGSGSRPFDHYLMRTEEGGRPQTNLSGDLSKWRREDRSRYALG